MSAALKLYQDDAKLSRKPPLGEKRPRLRLVWENPELSHGTQKEKPEVKPEPSYGRVLYNYYRYYDPNTGRYITSDPTGLRGGLNTYAYVRNQPLKYIDPYGLEVWGLNVGGGGTWFGKTSYSFQFIFDSQGNFGVQRTRELGIGAGSAAGVFGNLMFGAPDTIHDLEGWGGSISGSAWVLSGAVNLPISTDYQENDCGEFQSFEAGSPGIVLEAGLGLSIGTPEIGVTGAYTDTLWSTSVLGDIGSWIGLTTYDLVHWGDEF